MTSSDALDRLSALERGSPTERAEWLFEALYRATAQSAVETARFALTRYLPIFRAKHPGVVWPAELLADVGAWAAKHGTGLIDDPDYDSADTSFRYGLHALLVAWVRKGQDDHRTAAAATAIAWARSAFQTNVWAADDPDAFGAWAAGDLVGARRTMGDNVAATAVGRREWGAVVDRLRAEPAADPAPADVVGAALERWRELEHPLL